MKNIFGYIDASGWGNDGANASGTDFLPVSIDLLVPPRQKRNWQRTEELQLRGNSFGDRLTWILGGLVDQTNEPGGPNAMNIANTTINFGSATTTFEKNTFYSLGLYGSATFKITDNLNLSAGYRHSWDIIHYAQTQQAGHSAVISIPVNHYGRHFQGDTYNVGLDYHPSRRTMIYGGYRRGFKRGGFNESQTNPALASFSPETDDDFYLGLKNQFERADMPGQFNIEGYYDLYHGMQVSYLSSNGINLTTITANVPETTFRGLDMDLLLEPTDWLLVDGSYSLVDAFNTKWPDPTTPAGVTADLSVNPVPFVSKNKLSFTARFHTELPDDMGEFALAPTVNYQDKFYEVPTAIRLPYGEALIFGHQFNNLVFGGGTIPAYSTVDLRVEWNHLMGSRFDAAVNVTNLTNKLYELSTSGTLNFGIEGFAYGPPRMVTVELSTKF